jgi:hypothetical protein
MIGPVARGWRFSADFPLLLPLPDLREGFAAARLPVDFFAIAGKDLEKRRAVKPYARQHGAPGMGLDESYTFPR